GSEYPRIVRKREISISYQDALHVFLLYNAQQCLHRSPQKSRKLPHRTRAPTACHSTPPKLPGGSSGRQPPVHFAELWKLSMRLTLLWRWSARPPRFSYRTSVGRLLWLRLVASATSRLGLPSKAHTPDCGTRLDA